MATYNKTKAGGTNIIQLQDEVNQNVTIIPALMSITSDGDDLALEFTAALSGAEETELDSVIAAHTPAPQLIETTQLPFSSIDKKKLAVHPSYKPDVDGITTYAVWGGAGDELDVNGDLVDGGGIGGGPILHLNCLSTTGETTVIAKYHPDNGRIWLHEAYIKFTNGPENSYLSGGIIAMATPLQQLGNLDLVVSNNIVSYAPGGPGTGTHGFADPNKIVLVPRTFSHDGDWNYNPTGTPPLTPAAGDGEYSIFDIDKLVHRFVNRIPCYGTSPYFSITSDETTELPKHYYVSVSAKTTDGSNFTADWHASIILEIYRERTYKP